jgi:dolichyl-phosphate beta-glucosyltransferase
MNIDLDSSVYLSVVIPVYNESFRISSTLDRISAYLESQDYLWEVVVSNDGSTDETASIVQRHINLNSKIRLVDNIHKGKGWAVSQGMLNACGYYRMLCDADLSMPFEQIERLLNFMGDYDLAIGSRELANSRRFNEPKHRHLMGRIFNVLTRLMVLPGIKDSQCGFKMYHAKVVNQLFNCTITDGFAFDVEVLIKARKLSLRIVEVGIDWFYFKGSKVRVIKDTAEMFRDLIKIRKHYRHN